MEPLGYGEYRIVVEGDLAFVELSPIFGFFTFDHAAVDIHYREIDIEFGRFSDPLHPGAQFALQPFDTAGNHCRFVPPEGNIVTTHGFVWTPGEIRFRSARGDHPDLFMLSDDDDVLVASYTITGGAVPVPGDETVHINFWLHQGVAPDRDLELTVRSFSFGAVGSFR